MKQIAWERGLFAPGAKVHGKKVTDETSADQLLSLPHLLTQCWDFANQQTAIQALVQERGHILRMGVKGHPELAYAVTYFFREKRVTATAEHWDPRF